MRVTDSPERIWLQVGDDSDGMKCTYQEAVQAGADISWCHEQIFNCDIEYIRADLAPFADVDKSTRHGACGHFCEACARRNDRIDELGKELEQVKAERDALDVRFYEQQRYLFNAESILRHQGYTRCTAAACNCYSYHKDAS